MPITPKTGSLFHAETHGKDYIETVWGRGYVLREPSEDEARITA
jgi:DNA-binding winged helix-turn-helix (wHTH) protein